MNITLSLLRKNLYFKAIHNYTKYLGIQGIHMNSYIIHCYIDAQIFRISSVAKTCSFYEHK